MAWSLSLVALATLLLTLLLLSTTTSSKVKVDPGIDVFTNTYAVHIKGGSERAHWLARKHGFINLGEIVSDSDHYHFWDHRNSIKKTLRETSERHTLLRKEPEVRWIEQQVVKKRSKREMGYMPPIDPDENLGPRIVDNNFNPRLNDKLWPKQWYMKRGSGIDMNVLPAWKKGYSGKGVVVSILDDGIEKNHPDLMNNYDPEASWDVNNNDADPQPRYDFSNENRHGTRCAGEVAAEANNTICSVGVAFRAGIGGVRMLDGDVTDAVEGRSLGLNPQHVDIYSASWGPDDDGKTVDGPGKMAKSAFANGVKKGRAGRGSIFVWASGNGGRSGDSCGCDGYTNSIYTISVSSATERGNVPWYSEKCASTLATTYSSGDSSDKQVVTTDLRKLCTEKHSGTSASAPLAAGLCALALEANPNLSWRDLQHIIVRTARPDHLNVDDWQLNGAGRRVSHSFGYGLMDAAAMVDLARDWQGVPEQHICTASGVTKPLDIPRKGVLTVKIQSTGCKDNNRENILALEHVIARVSLSYTRRGDLKIHLTSPAGTRSLLLPHRGRDYSAHGFNDWEFLSMHPWGEKPTGTWTLEVENTAPDSMNRGQLSKWDLVLYGTGVHPIQKHSGPDSCERGQYMRNSYDRNSSSVLNECLPCHGSCLDCYGGEPTQCIQCQFNFHKRDTYCITDVSVFGSSPLLAGTVLALLVAVSIFGVILLVLVVQSRRRDTKAQRSEVEYSKLLEAEEAAFCSDDDGGEEEHYVRTFKDNPVEEATPSPPPEVQSNPPRYEEGISISDGVPSTNGGIHTA